LAAIPKTVDKSVDNYVDDSRDCLSNLYSYQIAQNMGNDKSNNINILQNNHRFLHLLNASAQIMPCKDAGRRIFLTLYMKNDNPVQYQFCLFISNGKTAWVG
jgi:hypothetical protein